MTVRITSRRWTKADGSVGQVMMADIRVPLPDGTHHRERPNVPKEITGRTGAKRWAETRARYLTGNGLPVEEGPPCPTLAAFVPRWMDDYAHANQNKPSTLDAKERINRLHLVPVLGKLPLNRIGKLEIQRVKKHLQEAAPKTVACVLSQLATMLRTAEEWEVIVKAPKIELPRIPDPGVSFYDFEEMEQLLRGAERAGPMVRAAILLGGDAGLRRGEILALQQSDVGGGAVNVRRSEWEGIVGTPKGGKARTVPLTARLQQAIREVKHLRGKRLLWQANGKPVGVETLKSWMQTACRRAGLPESRNLHRLRHTFCSHLAMRGAPAKVIQELAGHADLKTTMKYMHLARGSREAAISLLEKTRPPGPQPNSPVGERADTERDGSSGGAPVRLTEPITDGGTRRAHDSTAKAP
jgi:integrase